MVSGDAIQIRYSIGKLVKYIYVKTNTVKGNILQRMMILEEIVADALIIKIQLMNILISLPPT